MLRIISIAAFCVAAGLMMILGFVTWSLVFKAIPTPNREILTQLLGVISANVGLVVGFYFGATASSHKKDETIATIATNKGSTNGEQK